MIKHLLFFLVVGNVTSLVNATKNYYVIDGYREDNNVVKLWYTVLGLLDEYDKGLNAGFEIAFNQDGKHFTPECGPNWWRYYFAFNKIGSTENSTITRLPRYKRSVIRFNTVCAMPVERAHYLIRTYMALQPALLERINHIKSIYWPHDMSVVGVYYQHPFIPEIQQPWDPLALCKRVKQEMTTAGPCKLLLFTELDDFVTCFNDYFGSQCQHVCYLKNDIYTTPAQRGEHEIITLLLLAQCDMVIAPGSYQGTGARMINSTLQLKELDAFPYALK